MKGCFAPSEFPRALLPSVFARTIELSAPEQYTVALLFEYFPLGKVNGVPDDATAYRRHLSSNVLSVVYSKDGSDEAFRYSRDTAHELCSLITGKSADNLGYGNYSERFTHLSEDLG